MVVQFEPRQSFLPDTFKSSDVTVPYAVRDIDCAIAVFMDEIVNCKASHEALILREIISDCVLKLAAMESSALDRADRLCGGNKES